MLSVILTANGDTADVMYLVAIILFAVAAVVCFTRSAVELGLVATGLAFGFLGVMLNL